ncbi:MAG: DUF6291 domain-containing protein [Clostridium sp.]
MANNINSFSFFRDYYNVIKELSKEEQKDISIAILKYMFEDVEPEFKGLLSAVWSLLKRPLTTSKIKSKQRQTKTETERNENETKTETERNRNETKTERNRSPIS